MHRRTFLRLTVHGVIASAAMPVGGCFGDSREISAAEAERLGEDAAAVLASVPNAALIGAAYLEEHPEESSREALVSALVAGWSPSERREGAVAVARRIRQQQRQDFANGRTVELQGWTLSQTEARVSALTALP